MNIAALHLLNMMDYAEQRGVSRRQMLEMLPHPGEYLSKEASAVTEDEYYNLLEMIDERLQDELMGIRAGRYLNLKALGLIYRISMQATTIKEAFFYLQNYLEETFPILGIDTRISDQMIALHLYIDNAREHLNRLIIESVLMVISREIKHMAGENTCINLFSPFYKQGYPEAWSQGSRFGLQFKPVIFHAVLKDKSRLRLDILIPEYLSLIEKLSAEETFASKVKITALNLAKPELPDLPTVADSYNLTPRTLQRRLQVEGTTFQKIIKDLKRTISDMLLMHEQLSVTDISFVLGYSEPAAFIHSFKKWHGVSPQQHREDFI